MVFDKIKISKKEYFKLVENNIHYNLGSVFINNNDDLESVEKKLSDKDTFNNLEFLETNCLKCIGCKKNSVDFLHIESDNDELLHEQKKGKFYKMIINGIVYVYHYYNDSCNSVSFKAILI